MQKIRIPTLLTIALLLALPSGATHAQTAPAQNALWQTRCAGPARNPVALTCEASQSLRVKENGQLLFKVDLIFPADKGAPILQMQAPLGFYLPGKIRLAVDGASLAELEIGTCDQRGCFLSAPASADMIVAMKAGSALQIDFAPTAGNRQSVDMPLTGFTRAMDAIQ